MDGSNLLLCHALQPSIRDVLQQKGHTHFLALAEAAGITAPAPTAVLTIFAPSNQVMAAAGGGGAEALLALWGCSDTA